MEMFQVRYVQAAAKHLNFTKAAAECHVSQPALTKAIGAIEAELGAQLFHRERKRILLSDFGRSLLPHFEHILQEAAATRVLADNFRLLNKVPVRLGVMSTVGPVRLSRFLAKFQADFAGVEVSVAEASVDELKDRLEKAEIDLAVLNAFGDMRDGFDVHRLYEERYVVITVRRPAVVRDARSGDGRVSRPQGDPVCPVPLGTRGLGAGDGPGAHRVCVHARVFRDDAGIAAAPADRAGGDQDDLARQRARTPVQPGLRRDGASRPVLQLARVNPARPRVIPATFRADAVSRPAVTPPRARGCRSGCPPPSPPRPRPGHSPRAVRRDSGPTRT